MPDDCVITRRHYEYIAAHTRGDDQFLVDLKAAAEAQDIPRIWISPAQASLMQILLRAIGARVVVEVGTLAGYSAIAMARALPSDGRVHTIELAPAHADFAEAWVARSDVAARGHNHRSEPECLCVAPFAGDENISNHCDSPRGAPILAFQFPPDNVDLAESCFAKSLHYGA
jgi:hypothetical protein